jgi:hypothetical protein
MRRSNLSPGRTLKHVVTRLFRPVDDHSLCNRRLYLDQWAGWAKPGPDTIDALASAFIIVAIVFVGIAAWRSQFYVKFKFGWKKRTHEPNIAKGEHLSKGCFLHTQQDRHPPDLKRDLTVLIHSRTAP